MGKLTFMLVMKVTYIHVHFDMRASYFGNPHNVWKSQKKSHSTLRAKRATFTFWVDKSWLKMPKMVHFCEFLKTWSLRSNSVTGLVTLFDTVGQILVEKAKIAKFKWDILVIFKQCVLGWFTYYRLGELSFIENRFCQKIGLLLEFPKWSLWIWTF